MLRSEKKGDEGIAEERCSGGFCLREGQDSFCKEVAVKQSGDRECVPSRGENSMYKSPEVWVQAWPAGGGSL